MFPNILWAYSKMLIVCTFLLLIDRGPMYSQHDIIDVMIHIPHTDCLVVSGLILRVYSLLLQAIIAWSQIMLSMPSP